MGGLYITPNSSEMGWKRRGLRVSSEALLCLGVATIVASFVVDVNADGSKPNIWILIGGVIMIMAAAIGWSLTFCLIWESVRAENVGSTQNPKAPVHSIQVVVPEREARKKGMQKYDPTYDSYLAASSGYPGGSAGGTTISTSRTSGSPSREDTITTSTSKATTTASKGKGKPRTDKKRAKKDKKSSNSSSYTKTTGTTSSSRNTTSTTQYTSSSSGISSADRTSNSSDSRSYSPEEQRKSYV